MTEVNQNTENTPRLRTQKELFTELYALKHLADLAALGVENKMREMADELGSTFTHQGLCSEHPDAAVLQIRVRMNKKVGRPVPFFVPLSDHPKSWLGKEARDAKKATEVTTGSLELEAILEVPADMIARHEALTSETIVAGDSEVGYSTSVTTPREEDHVTYTDANPDEKILD